MQTQVIDFHPPAGEAAPFLLPDVGKVFGDRAQRLRALAVNHALSDWLVFLADLSQAQHALSQQFVGAFSLPADSDMALAKTHQMPTVNALTFSATGQWLPVMRALPDHLQNAPAPVAAKLQKLVHTDDEALLALGLVLHSDDWNGVDPMGLSLVACAQQVALTAMAAQLNPSQLGALDNASLCPCCGTPAVASVVRLGSEINNLRYLHCPMCNLEWNVTRAVCTQCGSDQSLALQEIEGHNQPVRAETCGACNSYLKIVYQEKDPAVDPVADDLASLALDLLVDEIGFARAGFNPFLLGAHQAG